MSELASEDDTMDPDRENRARSYRYVRETFRTKPSLVNLKPIAQGCYAELRYDGGPYDSSRFRLNPNGWDHEHCFLCSLRIEDAIPGGLRGPHTP
jgi:hypothetical protein